MQDLIPAEGFTILKTGGSKVDSATIHTARYITCTALTFLGIWAVKSPVA
jgi:hypothetical protein